jgi:flagellar biosynthesis repressor protein FlbT
MSSGLKITVKSGERIYINGAVLKMDRKVGIELMNEATFLLEQHILQPEGATTPLRQLYFMVQMMLIDPSLHARALGMAKETIAALHAAIQDKQIILGLDEVSNMIDADRPLHALKKIRAMYPLEVSSSERATAAGKTQKAVA